MGKNLYECSNQWAQRPPDERKASLQEAHESALELRNHSQEQPLAWSTFKVGLVAGAPAVAFRGLDGAQVLTHFSFGQLAERAGAPADYLRTLPARKACELIDYGLGKEHALDGDGQALIRVPNGENRGYVRCFASTRYERIWAADVTDRLLALESRGWRVPPARPAFENQPGTRIATEADCLSGDAWALSIKAGDPIAPAGLYLSDRDYFFFLVHPERSIDTGNGRLLFRGFFVKGTEVVGKAHTIVTFAFDHVCGNHIIWDVADVRETRIIHVTGAAGRWEIDSRELAEYADRDTAADVARVTRARATLLGASKDEVLDRLFGIRAIAGAVPRRTLELAYGACEKEEPNENPRSVWGMVQGLTRVSQLVGASYASKRVDLDSAGARILALAA